MAVLKQVILINTGGTPFLQIPIGNKTLLKTPYAALFPSIQPLVNLIYQASLSKAEIERMDFYFPRDNSWVVFELKSQKSEFLLTFSNKKGLLQAFFLSGSFEEDVFFENGKARNSDELLSFAKSHRWDHSGFIRSRDEILQILWGQHKSEKLQRFAWATMPAYDLLGKSMAYSSSYHPFPPNLINQILISGLSSKKQRLGLKPLRDALINFQKPWRDLKLAEEKQIQAGDWRKAYEEFGKAQRKVEELERQGIYAARKLNEEKRIILNKQKANKKSLNLLQKKIQDSESRFSQAYTGKLKELGYWEGSLELALKKEKEWKNSAPESRNNAPGQELLLKKNRWIQLEQAKFLQDYAARMVELEHRFQEIHKENQEKTDQVLQAYASLEKETRDLFSQQGNKAGHVSGISDNKESGEQEKAFLEELLSLTESMQGQELALLQSRKEKEELTHQASVKPFQNRIDQLNQWLENKSQSFYGWLDNRYPGWQKTIGKVVREDVLFTPGLNPNLVRLNDLLYGIQISIGELSLQVPTIEELNLERSELQAEIENQQSSFEAYLEEHSKQEQNLEKKYRSRIRQLRKAIQDIDIDMEQRELKRKKKTAEANQQSQVQKQVQHKTALQIEYRRQELDAQLEELRSDLLKIPQQLEKEKKSLLESYQQQLSGLEALYEEEFPDEVDELQGQDLEQAWLDKIHWIEKIPFFKTRISRITEEIIKMKEEADEEKKKQYQSFQEIEQSILSYTKKLERAERQLNHWKGIGEKEGLETELDLDLIMDQLDILREESSKSHEELLSTGKELIHHFSEQNIFQVPTRIGNTDSLEDLYEASQRLDEDHLRQVKESLGQQFSRLISQIAEQTRSLKEITGLLKKEIDGINDSLEELALGEVKLKLGAEESLEEIFVTLRKIQKLQEESGGQLGGASLFNPKPNDEANQQALSLLAKLEVNLAAYPKRYLDLARSIQTSLPKLPPSLIPWMNTSLVSLLAGRLKARQAELPLYLMVGEVDQFGKKWLSAWHEILNSLELGTVTSSQLGLGAADYDQVWIWKKEGWVGAKKN